MKRLIALLLAALALTGCASSLDVSLPAADAPVNLVYYTIGSEDPDLALVEKELNRLLLDRYGFTVSYRKIGWNDYINQLNGMINTNQECDVVFTWDEHYLSKASNGAFMDLTTYLGGDGRALYRAVSPQFWPGVTIRGQIFGVPTNKELATPVQLLFSRTLVEKYHLDVSDCRSLDDLEPMLQLIDQAEPGCIPLFFDSGRTDLMTTEGFEYLINRESPLMIRSSDPTCQIFNFYETEEAAHLLHTLRRYYLAGYINADATLRTSISRFDDEEVFCRLSIGGPDSSQSFSVDYGYPIIAVQAADAIVTNSSTQGGIMAINAKTKHPEEAKQFLTAVNTDPDIRNLLNFGVEGVHYRLTPEDQVEMISDRYRGAPYTQGNWFILKTMVGEHPDKWERYRQFNDQAKPSRLLGFIPNLSKCRDIYQDVSRVFLKYDNALMTGSVDPDVYLPKLCDELNEAGLQELIQILQSQVNAWLAEQHYP